MGLIKYTLLLKEAIYELNTTDINSENGDSTSRMGLCNVEMKSSTGKCVLVGVAVDEVGHAA